jgi:hypothetical protein
MKRLTLLGATIVALCITASAAFASTVMPDLAPLMFGTDTPFALAMFGGPLY